MSALAGRRIVLGVCGGIAAYKAVQVCRAMVDAGAHVSVVMTDAATNFVGEATFSALGSEPVRRSLFDDPGDAIPHTQLGQDADLVVVAPATAKLLSAYAHGFSHDLLTNVLIATRAPVLVCPAMHTEMWEHPAVRDNVELLRDRGVEVLGPATGRLAGGDMGPGRLVEPEEVIAAAVMLLGGVNDLAGLRVLVTAGGTREPIDPVRFLGNRSSGKQGHAIAEAAAARGAEVLLVTTTSLPISTALNVEQVETAAEMHDAVVSGAQNADVVVMAAAVADFTLVSVSDDKLKKADGVPTIELEPTVDILGALGSNKPDHQILVGFAAETNDVLANAKAKREAKGADLLVANNVSAEGVGFEHDTNEVLILSSGGERHVPLTDKSSVANAVLDAVIDERSRVGLIDRSKRSN
jgi:phosphopantothenoylcysteine decarboxylase/phosphopantothenate--cysteine ligase